jgi:hypothetical protein
VLLLLLQLAQAQSIFANQHRCNCKTWSIHQQQLSPAVLKCCMFHDFMCGDGGGTFTAGEHHHTFGPDTSWRCHHHHHHHHHHHQITKLSHSLNAIGVVIYVNESLLKILGSI